MGLTHAVHAERAICNLWAGSLVSGGLVDPFMSMLNAYPSLYIMHVHLANIPYPCMFALRILGTSALAALGGWLYARGSVAIAATMRYNLLI